MFAFFKKLFGLSKEVTLEESNNVVVTEEVVIKEEPKPVKVKKERKPKAAPKTIKTPKEKLKAKKEATKVEKPTPKKRGRPAKAK